MEVKDNPKPVVVAVKKPLRNRRFSKEILSETTTLTVLKVKHSPWKGEKIADTVRHDRGFNPAQRFSANRPL